MNLKKWSYLILIVILSSTVAILYELRNVKFDYDFNRYFPSEDDDLKFFNNYQDKYGTDSDFLLIGIENDGGIFNTEFLTKIKKLGDSIQGYENVEYVLSPVHNSFNFKQSGIEGISQFPIINPDFKNLENDSIDIYQNEKLVGSLFSNNSPSICFFVKTCDRLAKNPGITLANKIKKQLKLNGFTKYHISGRSIAQSHFLDLMMNELVVFFLASMILVILFLWLTFKSFWGVIIPLIVVVFSIIWSVGILHFSGKSFDIMMVMLPTIIFVVGMSDLVHFLNKYLDELRSGNSTKEAIKIAIKDIGLATFLTSATTAIGFLTLATSNIVAIDDFGIYAGIGVMVAYLLTFIIVPPILILTKVPEKLMEQKITTKWNQRLSFLFLKILKHKKTILVSSFILLVVGSISVFGLKPNNYLLEDLSDEDPQKIDVMFFENNFSGVRPFEMEITVNNKSLNIMDYKVVQEIDKIEQYLKKHYTPQGIGFCISGLDPIRYLYSIKHNNNPDYFKIPKKETTYNAQINLLKLIKSNELKNKLISQDSNSTRYSGKIMDLGSAAIKFENEKLHQFIKDSIQPNLFTVKLTGTSLLIDKNNEYLVKNILYGLLLSCAVIALIVGLMYRSFSLIIISLVVNILPLLLVCLVMYFLKIDLKLSTSLIFTLAFGIAVDDTIHLISKLKIELNKGKSLLYALKRSFLTTGKAMIVTSVILCSGFLTLIFSNFTSTYLMGLLVSITLFLALLADVILLPLLIIKFYKVKKKN